MLRVRVGFTRDCRAWGVIKRGKCSMSLRIWNFSFSVTQKFVAKVFHLNLINCVFQVLFYLVGNVVAKIKYSISVCTNFWCTLSEFMFVECWINSCFCVLVMSHVVKVIFESFDRKWVSLLVILLRIVLKLKFIFISNGDENIVNCS